MSAGWAVIGRNKSSVTIDLHHPEVALSEYEDNDAEPGGLVDAGEDDGRVSELRDRVAGVSADTVGESASQRKSPNPEGGDYR